jgi:hypothetical protein
MAMSPDAAGLFAQVDSALLIAIVVEAKAGKAPAPEDRKPMASDAASATLYALGLFCVLLSLAVTLTSVLYNRPLPTVPTRIVNYSTTMGFTALFYQSMSFMLPRAAFHGFRFWVVLLIMAAGLVWYTIWQWGFAPDSLWWNWW